MFYQLPPAGNPVQLSDSHEDDALLRAVFAPHSPRYFASGTAALAASIHVSTMIKGALEPEVILPAYGCPDLISAVLHAGAKPVLVDLEANRPWMDLDQVSAAITANTVAIMAASLCGIPERCGALRQIADRSAALLIEDSAQLFPGSIDEVNWSGDLVVISFGRGKPVSLLGGGAVLFQDERLGSLLPDASCSAAGIGRKLAYRVKALLYNWLIEPRRYWIVRWLPFLHIGETKFRQLEAIRPLDLSRRQILQANVARYMQQGPAVQIAISGMIESLGENRFVNLPAACQLPAQQRLLRYPLLIEPTVRDRVFARLSDAGLGASTMYPGVLPAIPGLSDLLQGQGPFPMAEQFARQLLTLPVHAGVRHDDMEKIAMILHGIC